MSEKSRYAEKSPLGLENLSTQHTLEEFAMEYFSPDHQPKKMFVKIVRGTKEKPWTHTKNPITQPLLKNLLTNSTLCGEAKKSFENIMRYMGDHSSKRSLRYGKELTDVIFEAGLRHEELRDEIYCQIVRQITENKQKSSEDRGWELMWLLTGTYACSKILLSEITKFLSSSRHNLAQDCVHRLQKTMRAGQRKHPPHLVEVEAIQHKTTQIYYKVYFPNGTDETFEVDSCLRAREICHNISNRLRLKSSEGFDLFLKIADRVVSVPRNEFFFDFFSHQMALMKRENPSKYESLTAISNQIFFMKKLWSTTIPGKDPIADEIFHYHQELPKLLRGYHKCTKQEAAQLAAFIYRVRYDDNKSYFSDVRRDLRDFLPANLIGEYSPVEWQRMIEAAYDEHTGKSPSDTATAFLDIMYEWPTFGSAFFEVKPTSNENLPDPLLVAINKTGINLIDPVTKVILNNYPFTAISIWSSGSTYFNLTTIDGTKIDCETSLGLKMDDLVTSYIRQN